MSTLLVEGSLTNLSVGEDTNDLSDTLQLFKSSSDSSTTFSLVLLRVLGEGLTLRAVPVLVETTLNVITQMFSHNSGNGTETTGSLNVTGNSTNNHRRGFNHGDSFKNFLLVHLRSRAVKITNNVSHTSLETHKGSKMDGLVSIITWE